MENELLLETFAYGVGHSISYFLIMGILISIFDLIYETALEKNYKRKSFIGKLSSREYSLLQAKINECEKDLNNENINELGTLLFCFVNAKKLEIKRRKKFWNKLKFWKRKDEKNEQV